MTGRLRSGVAIRRIDTFCHTIDLYHHLPTHVKEPKTVNSRCFDTSSAHHKQRHRLVPAAAMQSNPGHHMRHTDTS